MNDVPTPSELLDSCEKSARAGGAQLVQWRGRFDTREKAPADLVTDADVASQQAIHEVLNAEYPDHEFVGEESASATPIPTGKICWIVDPLDGTTNYVHGFPAYAVSVAAALDGELLVGTIFDPLSGDCYSAARGSGATKNGKSLQVSRARSLSDSLLAVSLPPQVSAGSPDLRAFCEVAGRCRAIRRTGSCAMNLAHVAAGVLDGFWAYHIHPWDVAAGILLVREAGGLVTAVDGGEFDLSAADFTAAAGPELHAELLDRIKIPAT